MTVKRLGFLAKLRQRAECIGPDVVHSSAPPAPAGVSRVLQKPMLFDRLISVVREYCRR